MHFMIDLETLSTSPNATITQIGVVAFDRHGVKDEGLRIDVDPEEQIQAGQDVSWSTIEWWLNQSDAARDGLTGPPRRLTMSQALRMTSEYFERYCGDPWKRRAWSNGAGFDVVIMEGAYRRYKALCPWNFSRVRDVRTLAALCPNVERVQPEVAHDALSDAIAQAEWMIACARDLGAPLA